MMFLLAGLAFAGEPSCEELKRDMKALEIFLQDQDDYSKYCPQKDWTQPDIEVYKKTLKSQLPKGCK